MEDVEHLSDRQFHLVRELVTLLLTRDEQERINERARRAAGTS